MRPQKNGSRGYTPICNRSTDRRIESEEKLATEVAAWEDSRNERGAPIKWQFTTEEARVKLYRLYPEYPSE